MDAPRWKTLALPLGGALLLTGTAGALYYYLTRQVGGGMCVTVGFSLSSGCNVEGFQQVITSRLFSFSRL